jgi:hypothetical protein
MKEYANHSIKKNVDSKIKRKNQDKATCLYLKTMLCSSFSPSISHSLYEKIQSTIHEVILKTVCVNAMGVSTLLQVKYWNQYRAWQIYQKKIK